MATSLAFDTEYYLSQNPDVLQYLLTVPAEQRTFNSAAEHYIKYGAAEGRDPNAFFDTSYYLAANPDVLVAYQQGIIDPFSHFVFYGAAEGRNPNPTWGGVNVGANFDEEAYLAANPDVADAIEAGTFTSGYQHFVLYGQYEDRPGAQLENGSSIPGETGGGIGGETFTLTPEQDTFIGTASNDLFQGLAQNLTAFDNLNGNGGTDTLNLITSGAGNLTTAATIQNIEIVNIDQTAGVIGNLNASRFVGAQQVWQIGAAADIAGVGVNTTAGFRDTDTSTFLNDNGTPLDPTDDFVAGAVTVTFTGATGSIALDNVADGSTFTVAGGNLTTLNISGSVDDDGATPAGPGTLVIDAAASVDDLATLNLSLSSDTIVDVDGLLAGEDFTTIDASASTGDLTLDLQVGGNFITSVSTGSGADTVSTGTFGADESVTAITVDVGAGNDTLIIDGDNNGTNNVALAATLGDGSDAAVIEFLSNIFDASEDEFASGIISITDFNGTQDDLDLSNLGATLATLSNTETTAISNADSLFDALGLVAGFIDDATGTAGDLVSFVFDGDTYVFYDADGAGTFNDGDGLIELTGFTGALNSSNFIV